MAPPPVKAIPKADSKTKVPTKKKVKVTVPTRYFAFDDHVDIKDLAKKPLRIKQTINFIPQDDDGNALDSADVTIEIYEMRAAGTGERANSLMLKITGKVTKAEKYNFVLDDISQDPKALPQVNKPKSKSSDLFLTAKLEVVGVDDKARGKTTGLEFVLPPMEYDETLELKMGSTIKMGSSVPTSASGEAKVTFSTYELMLAEQKRVPLDEKKDVPHGETHNGNLHHVVVHCMCAIDAAPNDPTLAFDVQQNLAIFRHSSGAKSLSAHYIIDRNGVIYEAVDIHDIAHHAYSDSNISAHGLFAGNKRSIGIELLGFADQFRDSSQKRFDKLKKNFDDQKAKLEKDKKTLEDALKKRQDEKAAGKKKVKVGNGEVDVDKAISTIQTAIADQDTKIAALKLDPWAQNWLDFISATDADGVPKVFKYTDEQYQTLGELLEVVGQRYGYELVCSHHYICPSRKTDPGIHFDWERLKPFLLPGELTGDESGAGGIWLVSI